MKGDRYANPGGFAGNPGMKSRGAYPKSRFYEEIDQNLDNMINGPGHYDNYQFWDGPRDPWFDNIIDGQEPNALIPPMSRAIGNPTATAMLTHYRMANGSGTANRLDQMLGVAPPQPGGGGGAGAYGQRGVPELIGYSVIPNALMMQPEPTELVRSGPTAQSPGPGRGGFSDSGRPPAPPQGLPFGYDAPVRGGNSYMTDRERAAPPSVMTPDAVDDITGRRTGVEGLETALVNEDPYMIKDKKNRFRQEYIRWLARQPDDVIRAHVERMPLATDAELASRDEIGHYLDDRRADRRGN